MTNTTETEDKLTKLGYLRVQNLGPRQHKFVLSSLSAHSTWVRILAWSIVFDRLDEFDYQLLVKLIKKEASERVLYNIVEEIIVEDAEGETPFLPIIAQKRGGARLEYYKCLGAVAFGDTSAIDKAWKLFAKVKRHRIWDVVIGAYALDHYVKYRQSADGTEVLFEKLSSAAVIVRHRGDRHYQRFAKQQARGALDIFFEDHLSRG